MKAILFLGAVVVSGCGGGTDEISCDPETERSGTYVVTWSERAAGTCGPVADSVVRLDENAGMSPSGAVQCDMSSPPSIEDSGCTISNSIVCVDASGAVLELTGITTQETDDGARLSGIADVTLRDQATAAQICTSTYDVTYTRQ